MDTHDKLRHAHGAAARARTSAIDKGIERAQAQSNDVKNKYMDRTLGAGSTSCAAYSLSHT